MTAQVKETAVPPASDIEKPRRHTVPISERHGCNIIPASEGAAPECDLEVVGVERGMRRADERQAVLQAISRISDHLDVKQPFRRAAQITPASGEAPCIGAHATSTRLGSSSVRHSASVGHDTGPRM